MLNRRSFLQFSSTGLAALALSPSILLTGCSLKGDAQAVLDTLTSIYNADPTAVWAPDLKIAIGDATTAIADWNGSSVNCELQSAFTIAAAILDSIPLGALIDLIVTVALAGANTLLADLAPCSTAALAGRLSTTYSGGYHSATAAYTQYCARFKSDAKWRVGGDYTKAFNAAAKASGLTQAVVK
jgi:hypothetical protein